MKRIIIIMLAGILVGLFLYYMNQAALEPTDGLTLDGKKVVRLPRRQAQSLNRWI